MLSHSPILWLVAMPLGNPGDLSPRARELLSRAEAVLAEDTRRAGLVCRRCGVQVRGFISFHEHNEEERGPEIVARLRAGACLALIADAGMPIVADPGYRLVRSCREAGIAVSVIPGPSAPVTALAGSGIAPLPFTFLGFLPRDPAGRKRLFSAFARTPGSLVFFERKDRLAASLADAHALLGRRELCIARELTKTHEEFIVSCLSNFEKASAGLLGELTVVIGPALETYRDSEAEARAALREEQERGGRPRSVVRRAQGRLRGWTGSELYALLIRDEEKLP
ncbi:MAG: 16S rRNA (cytidine(1402)-2'-O)-methyltransferase [Deltaproteobacteria bacterium]|jgi:16S rRNA (cytidine1402-2'-O)-methyltransferase|nr:16S rRNA (cytidine(1402)-2'-O)-methyltransferase [Deltaproteobacteria bacterium]